ncbi:hypothetical protein HDU92_002525 [Lobulomyces angularis]|nr:hypothetical protein HDU92_002525 [Lobulomyces angularis]
MSSSYHPNYFHTIETIDALKASEGTTVETKFAWGSILINEEFDLQWWNVVKVDSDKSNYGRLPTEDEVKDNIAEAETYFNKDKRKTFAMMTISEDFSDELRKIWEKVLLEKGYEKEESFDNELLVLKIKSKFPVKDPKERNGSYSRKLTVDDFDNFLNFYNKKFTVVPWRRKRILMEVRQDNALGGVFASFTEEGKIVCRVRIGYFNEHAKVIYGVDTSSSYMRQGHAIETLKVAVNETGAIGDDVYLFVEKGNEGAEKLYEKLGFTYLGCRSQYTYTKT